MEEEKAEVSETLDLYANSYKDKQMEVIPKVELASLRGQGALLTEAQENIQKLETSERNLRKTIEQLREGKVSINCDLKITNTSH